MIRELSCIICPRGCGIAAEFTNDTVTVTNSMMDVMKVLRETKIQAPCQIGDVILKDICGSDIVITKAVD